jgi:hypothetical protein
MQTPVQIPEHRVITDILPVRLEICPVTLSDNLESKRIGRTSFISETVVFDATVVQRLKPLVIINS